MQALLNSEMISTPKRIISSSRVERATTRVHLRCMGRNAPSAKMGDENGCNIQDGGSYVLLTGTSVTAYVKRMHAVKGGPGDSLS